MKYLCQLRRGWKYDTDPNTGLTRNDWVQYEQGDHKKPDAGELVLEYDNDIPRLKIGDGIHEFSELPYMSVDSFILPTPTSITINPDNWQEVLDENNNPIVNRYYQPVQVNNALITQNSKIDLQPSPEQLAIFHEKDLTFTVINNSGNVKVCVVGQRPTQQYTIQATVTEVAENIDEVIGNTTTTPNPQPDWEQNDDTKPDYIKNKPAGVECIGSAVYSLSYDEMEQAYRFGDYYAFENGIFYGADDPLFENADFVLIECQKGAPGAVDRGNSVYYAPSYMVAVSHYPFDYNDYVLDEEVVEKCFIGYETTDVGGNLYIGNELWNMLYGDQDYNFDCVTITGYKLPRA